MNSPGTRRIGLRFERLSPRAQAELDRFVFALMQRRTRAKTPEPSATQSATSAVERRQAARVQIGANERLQAILLPERPRGVLARQAQPALQPGAGPKEELSFPIEDISTTGCSFSCPAHVLFEPKSIVRLRLVGTDLDLELQAKVIYVQAGAPVS